MLTTHGESCKILVLGDVHGAFNNLKTILDAKTPDLAIVCGDYGVWTDFTPNNIPNKYNVKYPCDVYFVDGNHDNHASLDTYERGKIHKLTDKLYYCSYGSSLTINNKTILFCGGAESIDKGFRMPFVSWWPTECISESDQEYLPNTTVDIVISHTAPNFIIDNMFKEQNMLSFSIKCNDPSAKYLSDVYNKYKPKQWFFGHMHASYHEQYEHTEFYCLNMIPMRGKIYDEDIEACSFCIEL